MTIRIAVDAMGGDHAPGAIVDGVVAAVRHLDIAVRLVGPEAALRSELSRHLDADALAIEIADAPEAIDMAESPGAALRRKPRASIRVAAESVARGEAACLFSAGQIQVGCHNTGSLSGKSQGRRPAQAGATTGDEGNFIF